ncbi:MAG: hypothetical protein NTU61_02760 [Candidatus Altiarchaeota archaeon]|nr:hypothetical protein [Candidatus Altiarchaeota archaeon]
MRLDYTPLYVAFGIGLATYLFFRLSKITPSIKFNDVVYDKIRNEIHLFVENKSDKKVYVKPSLRLIKLTPALEWKEKTSNGNGIQMMSAAKGSVIKGYELIGEYVEPVPIGPKSVMKVVYPVLRDFGIRAYDNIRVDSSYGTESGKLESNLSSTVRMNLHDLLSSEEYLEELSRLLDDSIQSQPNTAVSVEVPVESVKDAASEDMKQPDMQKISKCDVPVQSLCVCCGKNQWLTWVVNEKHVCDECKDFLSKDDSQSSDVVATDSGVRGVSVKGDDFTDLDVEPDVEMFLAAEDVKLKPRFQKILELLDSEGLR